MNNDAIKTIGKKQTSREDILMFKDYDEVESRKQIGPERRNDCIVLK